MRRLLQDPNGPIRLPRQNPADPDSPVAQPQPGTDYEITIPENEVVDWDIPVPGAAGSAKADGNGRVRIPIPAGTGGQSLVLFLFRNGNVVRVEVEIRPER